MCIMAQLYRKFYKIEGLHNIFTTTTVSDKIVYNMNSSDFTPDFISTYGSKINEHTILFITCDREDMDRYINVCTKDTTSLRVISNCSTLIWARGDFYSISSKCAQEISYSDSSKQFTIIYSDGSVQTIKTGALGYSAGTNININSSNAISAKGYYFDEDNGNFFENPDTNEASNTSRDISFAHVEGLENYANGDAQHVCGRYALPYEDSILVVGNGDADSRSNAMTVSKDGVIEASNDVIVDDVHLSDLHLAHDDDWAIIG